MDKLDFLDEAPASAFTAAAPAPDPAPAAEPAATGPARGADGRFAAAEPAPAAAAPAPVPEAAPAAPAAEAPQAAAPAAAAPAADPSATPPGFVPVGVVQEMRRELQELKRTSAAPVHAPDPFEDPEGYQLHQFAERQAERVSWSQKFAEQKFGAELTGRVMEWAAARASQDRAFNQRALASDDPVGFAVVEYQREQALDALSKPETLAAFMAWQQGQAPAAPAQAAPVAVPPPPSPPPRSIAATPAASGIKPGQVAVGPLVAFDTVFKD